MNSVTEVLNSPIPMTLNGKEYQCKRLGIGELLPPLEQLVRRNCLTNIKSVGEMYTGMEKIEYLAHATMQIPTGDALYDKVMTEIETMDGIRVLLGIGLAGIKPEEVQKIMEGISDPEKRAEITSVVKYLVGVPEEGVPKQDGPLVPKDKRNAKKHKE